MTHSCFSNNSFAAHQHGGSWYPAQPGALQPHWRLNGNEAIHWFILEKGERMWREAGGWPGSPREKREASLVLDQLELGTLHTGGSVGKSLTSLEP